MNSSGKFNTFFSIPMLFGMGAASHLPTKDWKVAVGAIVIGFAIAQALYMKAAKLDTHS